MKIEVTHNKKLQPCYLGLLVVISRNCGGAYILYELDGLVLHRLVAAFCLVPYLAWEQIAIPSNILDINTAKLCQLEETELLDNKSLPDIASNDKYNCYVTISHIFKILTLYF